MLPNDFEVLLLAARNTVRLWRLSDAVERQSLQDDTAALTKLLYHRAVTAGLLREQDNRRIYDLTTLYDLIVERLGASQPAGTASNVIHFPSPEAVVRTPLCCAEWYREVEHQSLPKAVETVLGGLTTKEARVLRHTYGIGVEGSVSHAEQGRSTWMAVAKMLGYPPSTVAAVHHRAIRKLRHPARAVHIWPHIQELDQQHAFSPEAQLLHAVFDAVLVSRPL